MKAFASELRARKTATNSTVKGKKQYSYLVLDNCVSIQCSLWEEINHVRFSEKTDKIKDYRNIGHLQFPFLLSVS